MLIPILGVVLIVGVIIFLYQIRKPMGERVGVPQGEVFRETSQTGKLILTLGEKMSLGAFTIEFVSVIEDSRCPEGVDCVQPGEVILKILVKGASFEKEYALSPLRHFPLSVGEYYLRLQSVDPRRLPDKKIEAKEYRANFFVVGKNFITVERAKEKAQELLGKRWSQGGATLSGEPQEYGFGWVFPYHADTTVPMATNSMTGPLAVFRDGTASFLTSSETASHVIHETEREWGKDETDASALMGGHYGDVVRYSPNQAVRFQDFDVLFFGITESPVPNNTKLKTTTYNFLISRDSDYVETGWSSGLGAIAPTTFSFRGKKYLLEKGYSQGLSKWLADDEFVITAPSE